MPAPPQGPAADTPSVVTIGTFDGVHRGHAALVRAAREMADRQGARVVALVFDPHPATALRPGAAPVRVSSMETKSQRLTALGVDHIDRLAPGDGILELEPKAFVEKFVLPLRPVGVVEGPDFGFGKGRAGDVRTLGQIGEELGFEVRVVPEVDVALTDHSIVRASSTITRWLLEQGRVRDAASVLGRCHSIRGSVVRGDQRGRLIGFPTANVDSDELAPADGVYAGVARLDDGRSFAAAVNVGKRPTFEDAEPTVEAHLLDAPATPKGAGEPGKLIEGLDEYHWPITIELLARIRDEIRFPSVDHLTEQLARDCARVREVVDREDAIACDPLSPTPPTPRISA